MHAQQAGELLTGLDGHPSQKIANIYETNDHSIKGILEERDRWFNGEWARLVDSYEMTNTNLRN